MGEKFLIKRNTITNERPRYVAHYGGKIKLREKPSQMNVAHYAKKKNTHKSLLPKFKKKKKKKKKTKN
jgi:hypothetical protein